MDRSWVVIGLSAVIVLGMYVGFAVGVGVVHDSLLHESGFEANSSSPGQFSEDDLTDGSGNLQFEPVDVGLDYTYESTMQSYQEALISNAGVYVEDYNSNGKDDVLAIGGPEPVLFENVGGAFEATDAIPHISGFVRAAHWIDYDGSGEPDLILFVDDGPPVLLENNDGQFEKRPDEFDMSLAVPKGATSADYTGDGNLDLFVYQNGDWNDRLPAAHSNYSIPINEDNGNPDYLYRNTGDGFELVEDAGITGDRWTLAASFVDLTNNGLPDIHTANDINHDVVYLNRGDGTFEQVQLPERTNRNGMSSEVADVTGNGHLDVFVTNVYYPDWAVGTMLPGLEIHAGGNNLISPQGEDSFVMREDQFGLEAGGWGWAAVIDDFTNNGQQDIVHTTSDLEFNARDLSFTPDEVEELNAYEFFSYPVVFERDGENSFEQLSAERTGFDSMDSRGMASLDYNQDGTLDLVIATTDGYQVYENQNNDHNAIFVDVRDETGSYSGAYGATITVDDGVREQTRHVHDRQDFLTQNSRLAHVGIGSQPEADVHVVWPDGTERTFEDIEAGHRIVVTPDGIQTEEGRSSGDD